MRISSLLDPEKRRVSLIRLRKKFHSRQAEGTVPVMLLGAQRSGTSMLMRVLELHPDTQVFTEDKDNQIYFDYRLRDFDSVQRAIDKSWARTICFKPIADSHLATDLIEAFPSGRFVWVSRHYRDVALSRIAAFEHSDRAIKIVCDGGTGGGWFQEGISEETLRVLQSIERDGFSRFDYACLVWWARNRIFIEQKLSRFENVLHIRYERLLDGHSQSLFEFINYKFDNRFTRFVRPPRAHREYPPIRPIVQELCEDLEAQLKLECIP